MELMDEQEMIRKAYFDATQASGLPPQWIYEFALNLLAAHNAGAQGEPIPGSPAFSLRGLYKPAQEYFIDGKPATPEEYIDWQSRIIEAVTKAKLPDPKYYGTQDEDGNEHDVKCAYVDGWNQCRASILEVKPLAQMPLDDERNAFEAWAASKGHRFNDGDLNHCKSWALSAWLRRAEIAGAHPQPITDAAQEPVAWPYEITRGHIECLIADHQRDGQKHLKSRLNSSGSYLIRVAESFRWCLEQIDAAKSNAHPQPITDAARDAFRWRRRPRDKWEYKTHAALCDAETVQVMLQDGWEVQWLSAIDAEIERIDCAKGE